MTLVRVGPVIIKSPRDLKNEYESFSTRLFEADIPDESALNVVDPSTKAPAASVASP